MKPVVLCILDGVGLRNEEYGNAFKKAKTPNFDMLWEKYPHTFLEASGEFVGIPKNQMGSSEVGHTNIGAGRIVYQNYVRINKSIEDKSFYSNSELLGAIENCKKNNSNLHICGMVSDGGIHSHVNHLLALLDLCKKENFDRVFIHVLLDGRDTLPKAAIKYVDLLKEKINLLGIGTIVTVGGRYYLMNRDRDWKLTKLGYDALINGNGENSNKDIVDVINEAYNNDLTDEFIKPTILDKKPVEDKDSLILFNFRSDRMIQLIRSLTDPDFNEFQVNSVTNNLYICSMVEYEDLEYEKGIHVAFKPIPIINNIGEYISKLGYNQLRLTEAEKRGHVTFYFSGCNDFVFDGEDRIIYDKDDVFTYDEKPSMRSTEITNSLIESINSEKYEFIVVNYPNGDALGHTGVFDKAVEGLESLDKCLGRIITETDLDKYNLLITADHGNCEKMIESDGTPNKAHTTSLVPLILINKKYEFIKNGKLGDIAPTILKLMGLDVPIEMTGDVLIK